MVKENDTALDFTLKNYDGQEITLSQFRGKKIVLYFYPKDNTPGCTTEACGFRDAYDLFLEKGAVVIGVSADTKESHEKFRNKFNLPFYLLSDDGHTVLKQYDAWGEKNIFGKSVIGIKRMTFIIDENFKIKNIS